MKIIAIITLLIVVGVGVFYFFPGINYRGMPDGLIEGRLPEDKPNWVSSKVPATNPHYIAPLKSTSLTQLASCIQSKMPEVIVKNIDTKRLIAYRSSTLFHFVDWLCIDKDGAVSSSATMGYSDFGKNRELIETIRQHCS